jgi:hypothetical protein
MTVAELPDELAQVWLQHIRNFDIVYTGKCKFSIFVHEETKSTDELKEMLNIQPPLQSRYEKKT